MTLFAYSQLLLFLRTRWLLSNYRIGQADSEVVSAAWSGKFTMQAACPLQGKDKQMNKCSSEPPSAISGRNLKQPLSVWVPWVTQPFQVMTVYSRNVGLQSVAQGVVWSRSLLDHISVCLSVSCYRSSSSSQFYPVDTGSYKDHFFQTEDRRLYELHDSSAICGPSDLTPHQGTVPAQQTSRNEVSP